ncbi:MAG: class I SAM-dependent methyltransferase [Sphingomonadales bacterium]
MITDSTSRFSSRVADYVQYRPTYPDTIVTFLREECGVAADALVADIGAGTGISTRLFLDAGHKVIAVEPNRPMLEAAVDWLGAHPGFRFVEGTAEATTLPDASVDLVIAAQAFHWFDPPAARREFGRILKPGGKVALFWNSRLLEGSDFLEGYEALLQQWGVDYGAVAERYSDDNAMAGWFGDGFLRKAVFPNVQVLDFNGLVGRLSSSSYAPAPGHPDHVPMMAALRELFDRTARNGTVDFRYSTRLYVGSAEQ